MMFLRTLAWGFLWCIGALALLHFLREDEPVYLVEMPLVRAQMIDNCGRFHPGPSLLAPPPASEGFGVPQMQDVKDRGTA